MSAFVIAIDGAAGSGKSTLAKALSLELGLPYVNTGLMYRALAAAAIAAGLDLDDAPGLAALTRGLTFTFTQSPPGELQVEGWPTPALTLPDVEANVSRVARHPQVRAIMRAIQRAMGERAGAVMEGRDIGSVVFPDASVKFFLTADPSERGARRAKERGVHDEVVAEQLAERDRKDEQVNPFEPAPDAVVIDNTELEPSQTLDLVLRRIRGERS